MDFNEIFENYYTLYRGESDTPPEGDEEYIIGMRYANNAISRWANVDGTYWKELFTTLRQSPDGDKTVVTGKTAYICPSNMREAGGYVKVLSPTGALARTYEIIEPQEAQFRAEGGQFCYFTGNPSTGFTMNLGGAPDESVSGFLLDYVYYKKPTIFETGDDVTEVPNPWFIVHHMLYSRYRVSRNPFLDTALRDAEEALKNMQQDNASGTWANPWKVADNSGVNWGV